jgi:hypothetical protein
MTCFKSQTNNCNTFSQPSNLTKSPSLKAYSKVYTGLSVFLPVTPFQVSFKHIDPLKLSSENNKTLSKIAEQMLSSEDKSLSNTAREVVKICKSL